MFTRHERSVINYHKHTHVYETDHSTHCKTSYILTSTLLISNAQLNTMSTCHTVN